MSFDTSQKQMRTLALIFLAAGLTGCVEYTIESTVNTDGSGLRVESMEAAAEEEVAVAPEDFPSLMSVRPEDGWTHTEETDEDGDTIHHFQRRTVVADLASWSDLSGQVRISGAVLDKAGTQIGYVTLGDVQFRNAVQLRRAADSDGKISFAYRETFTWERAVDAMAELLLEDLDDALHSRYPRLSAEERGQIVGFARARFWVAVDEGLLSGDGNEDALMSDAAQKTADQGLNLVRQHYPEEGIESLTNLFSGVLVESDERLVAFLEEELPGLNIAFNSEIIFRLNMPGRVTDSNAHERDGTTLVWEFGPGDALHTPVEVYAESVIEG
jgi:hypothetical protein